VLQCYNCKQLRLKLLFLGGCKMPFAVLGQNDGLFKSSKRIELKAATPANATAIAEAINAVTGNSVVKVGYSTEISSEDTPGTGNLGREAVVRFVDATGKIIPFRLRGMINSCFLPGGALDVTNADVIALGQALITYALLSDGEAVLTLHSGEVVD
jgi:hypothetical protein